MSNVKYTPVPSTIPFLTSDKFFSIIVGPYGCLAGDTLVITEFGAIPISDIDRPMRVLSWNEKTCRFQLSLSSGAFPKGRDYLHRVVTREGEFDAAAEHRLLCADGEYRRVSELRPGHALASCSENPLQTTEGLCRLGSHEDGQHYTQTDVNSLESYAASARQYGQRFLTEEDTDLGASPSPDDARKCVGCSFHAEGSREGGLLGRTPLRILRALFSDLLRKRRSFRQSGSVEADAAGRTSTVFFERVLGSVQAVWQSLLNYVIHLQVRLLSWQYLLPFVNGSYQSPCSLSLSNRPILSIAKIEVKQAFWDMQVESTHNYVTVDGAIHHNSTKTTAGIYKIAYEAAKVAACKDGIRRSRYAWIRQTRQMITDSSLPDFLKAFPDGVAGTLIKSDLKFLLKYDDVECEILFRGLDESTDVRRLLSTQLTGAIIEEARECNPDIFEALTGRVGRYPDGILVPHRPEWGVDKKGNPIQGCVDDTGKSVDKIWAMTNPPDWGSWWEEKISAPEENMHVTIQPSGLSEDADWVHLLKSDYYENMAVGKSEAWKDVYIHAKFGKSLSGKPVFSSFNRDVHVAKKGLIFNPVSQSPLIVGVDTALHPSAVFMQRDSRGRLLVFHSAHAADMGALRFFREVVKPVLASRFGSAKVRIVIDPAGMQRSQNDESTVADIVRAEGLVVVAAHTNSIAARIAAVDSFFTRMVDGEPGVLIDPEHNHELIMALAGKYRYKTNKNGETADVPDKQRPWADLVDGMQYGCLYADGGTTFGREVRQAARREIKPAVARGWT